MINDAKLLKSDTNAINDEITRTIADLQTPINYEDLSVQQDEAKAVLKAASKTQKSQIKAYEKNNKKYKLLQKYGNVLKRIEKLLGLIPSDLTDLSTEDISEKLKNLITSRNKSVNQACFSFYQDTFANITKDLLRIESAYNNKTLTAKDAYFAIMSLKSELSATKGEVPKELEPSQKELAYLIKMYADGFCKEKSKSTKSFDLTDNSINAVTQLHFENLNKRANNLTKDLNSLKQDLTNFEPAVDLSKLLKQLKSTDKILNTKEWDVDVAGESVLKLRTTTNSLIKSQNQKNKQHEKYSSKIKDYTTEAKELSTETIKKTSVIMFETANERAENTKENVEELMEEAENGMSENLATQYANVVQAQLNADNEECEKIAEDPEAESTIHNPTTNDEAYEKAEDLKELAEKLAQERTPQLHPNQPIKK